ncbi:hypothetical protein [uncultured Novosphingobium sp.]|uniref:hypothetical protein n=1 Tax=uncultured Novosphingobium sp. TaxID=292277 RepID=UPI00258B4D01|nr:hypothetical protein [uncultured Novosphingobium sp.]
MFKVVVASLTLASAAVTGLAAAPAMAQDRYDYTEHYEGRDGSYYRSERREEYDGDRDGYRDRDYYRQGYRDQRDYRDGDYAYRERPVQYRRDVYRDDRYRRNYGRCTSGTTGTIIGGVVGGLLGREIGRGGYYNRPSGTGLILGAGAGALAGRALERNGCR